ncbi:MAG: rod shape-determining protein MreC [Bryobacterales bacterium]|nr:rod shape-determining protein MreC [Bryobacterales bacterium]
MQAQPTNRGSPAKRIAGANSGRLDGILLAALVLAQAGLVVYQIGKDGKEPSDVGVGYWVASAVSPVQHAAAWAARSATSLWSAYRSQVEAVQEIEALDAQARNLRIQNERLEGELLAMKARLETDTYRSSLDVDTLAAKVIVQRHAGSPKQLVVNRGMDDGIRSKMAVLAPGGIVGRVFESYKNSATVMLLHDPDSAVGVVLAGSGARGVLVGTEGAACEIRYIRSAVPVAPGERIYTSGMDGIYPRGLPVGAVRSVDGGQEMHRITVRLAADMERLTDVAILLQVQDSELPEPVRIALDDSLKEPPTGAGRVKVAFSEALAEQERQIGETGRSPPDFSAVVASLGDSGGLSEASSLNEE